MPSIRSVVSLCIAEYPSEDARTPTWRVVADQIVPPRGGEPRFEQAAPDDNTHLHYRQPAVGEVLVCDWTESRKQADGSLDVRPVDIKPIEITEPYETKELCIENQDAVRQILRKGISIPDYTRLAFQKKQIVLGIAISSENGRKLALLFDDPQRVTMDKTENSPDGRTYLSIANTPEDLTHTVEFLRIADVTDIPVINYRYRDANRLTRTFLARTPALDGTFMPYTKKDMAPIFFKRVLRAAGRNHVLTSGNKLTRADLNEILGYIEGTLKDADEMSGILQIDDPAVVAQYADELKPLLPELMQQLDAETGVMQGLRDMLFSDETIRERCVAEGRDLWLASKAKEKEEAEKLLDKLAKDSKNALTEREKAQYECRELAEKAAELHTAIQEQEAQIKTMANRASDIIKQYQKDVLALAQAIGIQQRTMPYAQKGRIIETEEHKNALVENLKDAFLTPRVIAHYIHTAINDGTHFIVPASLAQEVADAVSIAYEGKESSCVTRTDDDCRACDIIDAIATVNTTTVLIEGVFACMEDFSTLAIMNHVGDKILVFSMDDPRRITDVSPELFTRAIWIGYPEQNPNPARDGKPYRYPIKEGNLVIPSFSQFTDKEKALSEKMCRAQKSLISWCDFNDGQNV